MKKNLFTTLLLLVTYFVNYLSSSGQLGISVAELGQIFPFAYMPPGWTFMAAWGAIYLALAIYVGRSRTSAGKKSALNQEITPLFRIVSVLNIIRIYMTSLGWFIISVIIITLMMLVLRRILALMLEKKEETGIQSSPFLTMPFGLYAGRITMATSIVAVSQLMASFSEVIPFTQWWSIGVVVFGIVIAGYVFSLWKNRAQGVITLVALAGVLVSLVG